MRRKWGIYKGFNPRTNPLNKWVEPVCPKCNADLTRWIDWRGSGSIGYCSTCKQIYVVKSHWIPSPKVHIRTEIAELTGHEVKEVNTSDLQIDVDVLFRLHDSIPLTKDQAEPLFSIKGNICNIASSESILIQHMIWSLLFNSDTLTVDLAKEYIRFVFKNPHYIKMYEKYSLWIGDEIDIAEMLEQKFKNEITQEIYNIWESNKDLFPEKYFKARIGFYITLDDEVLEDYSEVFRAFARKIRVRF